jgi:hypothetical protein
LFLHFFEKYPIPQDGSSRSHGHEVPDGGGVGDAVHLCAAILRHSGSKANELDKEKKN